MPLLPSKDSIFPTVILPLRERPCECPFPSAPVSANQGMDMLFKPDFPRTEGLAGLRENSFKYLQRSNRPQAMQIREWMEEWFDGLPPNAKGGIGARLQKRESQEFPQRPIRAAVSPNSYKARPRC